MKRRFIFCLVLAICLVTPAMAVTDCSFDDDPVGKTLTLLGDCTTDTTLFVPDEYTFEGNGFLITGVDPAAGHFTGAVLQNAGSQANIQNVRITVDSLTNVCDAGANRLRGIMLIGASGSITSTEVIGVNQGNSGCQEGNAIEVRNEPFDGNHPNTQFVTINNNYIDHYQKTGIVANGDVEVSITNNFVGSAGLDDFIAANSVQVGFGAKGTVNNNQIVGNDWDGPSDYVGTAVLVYLAGDANVNHNTISGEGTDIGVFALYSGTVNVMKNTLTRSCPDDGKDDYGTGVWFYGNGGKSKVVRNTVGGWLTDFDGADLQVANVSVP